MRQLDKHKGKLCKTVGKSLVICFIFIVIFLTGCYINHRIQLNKEDSFYKPIGQQVTVNGHKMNVYVEGQGDKTLVFMAGAGTSSPVLDFMSLGSLLSEMYQIVVVEKAGYGFSEDSDVSRDIDTMLSETREALKLSGVDGPYILCPHSMSGIEAIYWAEKYPQEIEAIIGLDMAVPETYENFNPNILQMELSSFANRIGFTRLLPNVSESDAMKYGTLTENEKKLCRAVFYRRTLTKAMRNEVRQVKANAELVGKNEVISVPVLIFSSNGSGTGWEQKQWRDYQKNYINKLGNGRLISLNCAHYVHDLEYEKIDKEIRSYLSNL